MTCVPRPRLLAVKLYFYHFQFIYVLYSIGFDFLQSISKYIMQDSSRKIKTLSA